jgi:hypothetical protein
MNPKYLNNYRNSRKDFLDKKDAKEKDIAARIEKIKAERELRKAEREKFYAERAAKGKLSTSEKISKHMQDAADEDPMDKTKSDIFGEKDIKGAKTAADKAALMTANETKKSTAIADKQLSEQIKTTSILERIYRFFTGNKSMKIDGDVEEKDTRSNIEKANDDTNIIAANMSANSDEIKEKQEVKSKNKKSSARIDKKKAKRGSLQAPLLTTVETKESKPEDILSNANDKVNAAKASVEAIDAKMDSTNIKSTATNTAATHHAVKHGFTQVTNYLRMMWAKSVSGGIGDDIGGAVSSAAGMVSGGL